MGVMSTNWPGTEKRIQYFYKVLAIVLTSVIGAFGLVNWFYIREAIMTLLMYYKVDPFAWRAIDNFSMVGLGMLWLVLVLVSPYILLRADSARGFWKNASLIAGVQLVVLIICLLISRIVVP